MRVHPYLRVLPRVRVWSHGAYLAMRPRAGCFTSTGLMVALLIVLGRALAAQVDAVLHLRGRDGEMRVANPTTKTLQVSIALFTDSTLTDTVQVRISPRTFSLDPGASQTVRLRLHVPAPPGAAFRLATTFTPEPEVDPAPRPTMRFIMAVRYLVRVEVQ